jgi:hypothetical protein
MSCVNATPRFLTRLAERHTVLFVIASTVFWTVLSPLTLVWLAVWLVSRHRALDKSPAARRERRVRRLVRWYPAEWRARYGEELAATLHDAIADGHGGPRLSANVAKEGLAARLAPPARRHGLAAACIALCWIPLFPQGIVPAVMKLTDAPTRSWFLALYLPDPVQWPAIAAMVVVGLAMLRTGTTVAGVRLIPRRG